MFIFHKGEETKYAINERGSDRRAIISLEVTDYCS